MTASIALLGGVNAGQNSRRMERLRAVCAGLHWRNPKTYLQSGNLMIEAEAVASHCVESLERRLALETHLPVPMIVKKAAKMAYVICSNPHSAFEEALSERAVTRNWNSVRKLYGLATGSPANLSLSVSRRRKSCH